MTERTGDEISINVRDLIASVLLKWRLILLLGILAFIAYSGWQILEIRKSAPAAEVEPSETYTQELEIYNANIAALGKAIDTYRKRLADVQDYLDGSILLKINPFEKAQTRSYPEIRSGSTLSVYDLERLAEIYIAAISDYELLKEVAEKRGTEPRFITELVSLSTKALKDPTNELRVGTTGDDAENASETLTVLGEGVTDIANRSVAKMELSVGGITTEETASLYEDIKQLLLEKSEELKKEYPHELVFGEPTSSVISDRNLLSMQTDRLGQVTSLNKSLQSALDQSRVVEKPSSGVSSVSGRTFSMKMSALAGAAGLLFGAVLAALLFLLSPAMKGRQDPARLLGLRFLGAYEQNDGKKLFGFVDRAVMKKFGGNTGSTKDETDRLVAEGIRHFAGESSQVAVSGNVDETRIGSLISSLQSVPDLKDSGICLISAPNLIGSADARRAAGEAGAVVLAEVTGKSSMAAVREEVQIARDLGCEVLGYVCL